MSEEKAKAEEGFTLASARWVLLALCVVAFWPFLFAELFWDDYLVIRPDGPIASLSTLRIAFFGRCVLFDPEYDYPYYRPLIDSLFVIEYTIARTHPFLYHLTNFALHLGNVTMFFALLRRLCGGLLPALLGAAVFGLHPIQVESVLWPAARPAVLCTFFSLLAAHAYRRLHDGEDAVAVRWLLAMGTVVAFVAALLSKEIAIALVPVALLLLFSMGRKLDAPRVSSIVGLCVALVVYLAANRAIGGSASHLGSMSPAAFLMKMAEVFGFYLTKLVVPWNLAPALPPDTAGGALHVTAGWIGALVLVSIFLYGLARRHPAALIAAMGAALFGGGAVLPLLGGQTTVADRYVYQAMLGLGMMAAALPERGRLLPWLVIPVLLAVLSMRQSSFWISAEGMWERVVEVAPDSIEGNFFVAEAHARRGNVDLAVLHYTRAAFPESGSPSAARFDAAMALGTLHLNFGQFGESDEAYAFAETYPPYRNDALLRRAIVASMAGDTERAREILSIVEPAPADPARVYTNLALLEWRLNQDAERALAWYQEARARGAGPIDELDALRR